MLLFKKIDVYGQLLAIIPCFGYSIFKHEMYALILIYFVVGGWQIISMLLNMALAKNMPLMEQRKKYQHIILVITFLCLLAVLIDILMMFLLFGLLISSPFLAGWYFNINYKELKNWEARQSVRFR